MLCKITNKQLRCSTSSLLVYRWDYTETLRVNNDIASPLLLTALAKTFVMRISDS